MHTALLDEIAESEARAIDGREPDYVRQSSVHAVSDKRHSRGQFNHGYGKHTAQKSQGKHQVSQHQQKCFQCNGDHLGHECRFRDAVCHACGRTGHIQKACRKKGAMSTNVVNAKCTAEGKQTADYSLYSLSTQQNAVTVHVEVDGKSIDMLVDTGSGVTVIGERTFHDVWKHKLPLLRTASQWPIQGGGPRGPGPPLRESKKLKKGPINGKEKFCVTTPPPPPLNHIVFLRSRQISATTPPPLNDIGFLRSWKHSATTPPPPTESPRVFEITENFCYYPPPSLNRVDMALHTKAGPLLRKILDLRLRVV